MSIRDGHSLTTESHITDLVDRKAQAHAQRGMGRLRQAVPASVELLTQAGARGENLGSITAALLRLVDRYGAREVQAAVLSALARKVPHPMRFVWHWRPSVKLAKCPLQWRCSSVDQCACETQ